MEFNSSPRRLGVNRQILNVGCYSHVDTHTFLLATNLFMTREVPLKSNLSPSCCKLTPVLGMEKASPSNELLQLQKNSTLSTRGPGSQIGFYQGAGRGSVMLCFAV